MPVSVRFSLDWEAVTTPDATILGVALAERAARDGEAMHGDTYSRSRSSAEPLTMQVDGVTYFDRPRV